MCFIARDRLLGKGWALPSGRCPTGTGSERPGCTASALLNARLGRTGTDIKREDD